MTDWARAIATKLEVGIEGQEPEQFIAAMSNALRKAKADGMREAAEIANYRAAVCEDAVHEIQAERLYASLDRASTKATENCARLEANYIAELIEEAASKLDPPSTV